MATKRSEQQYTADIRIAGVTKVGAYIRYLRYNVDGCYNRKSADIRKELKEREVQGNDRITAKRF